LEEDSEEEGKPVPTPAPPTPHPPDDPPDSGVNPHGGGDSQETPEDQDGVEALEEESEEEDQEEPEEQDEVEALEEESEEDLHDESQEEESPPADQGQQEEEDAIDAHLDADSQMQDLDKDKDGYLTLEEFKADHEKETYYKAREQEISSIFAKNDKNKDNKLDKQEMRAADQEMSKMGM